jgi:hypothetical protein
VFAWIWFGFGSSVAMVFLRNADLTSWARFNGALATASAISFGCEDTHASEGGSKSRRGTPIFANRYRFMAGDREIMGVSYATGRCLTQGAAVMVEHPAGNPDVSRIVGMRRAQFGPELLFVAIFPAVGLVVVGVTLRGGRRQLRLLAEGKLALGRLVGKEATHVRINRRQVMKLRFALETETGARHEVVVKTHVPEKLEDEPRERLLYDPARPTEVVAWDLLTSAPTLDGAGALQPKGVAGTAAVLLPPALAVLGHLLALGAG